MKSFISVFTSIIFFVILTSAQHSGQGYLVDEFLRLGDDDLLARVDHFNKQLVVKKDTQGVVVLYGPTIQQYLMQRKIEGCNLMMHQSTDMLKFVFAPAGTETRTKFYAIPVTETLPPNRPDFKLPDLKRPIELNHAFSTDEFCPIHFDVHWYSRFMNANSNFRGRVIIDSSKDEFFRRVTKYREHLKELGISPKTVRFLRQRFYHERDEQWWLIPPKRK